VPNFKKAELYYTTMAEDPKINQSCMAIADDLWLNRYNNDDAVKQGDIETMLELNKQNLIKDV